jgi:exoribonuclease R
MMPRRVKLAPTAEELITGFERIREQMRLPRQFPTEVLGEARAAQRNAPQGAAYTDAREIDFITIDPEGSLDLDQAFHAERDDAGYVLHYAIADVASFVAPGSALDRESRSRGQTLYSPDERIRLYPPELSEDAASLLPHCERPAILWTFRLDEAGRQSAVDVRRAVVRSRRQLTYAVAQEAIDGADAAAALVLLREIGQLRQKLEQERGGISLEVPEQEVLKVDSSFRLAYRAPLPVEGWNAQISLLTGMAAAAIMVRCGVGLIRTMPPPEAATISKLRHSAGALGTDWPASMRYPDFIRTLDARLPAHAALLTLSTQLFRGVGYVAFSGQSPQQSEHHAIAAPYAHVTAPLRRMADRYANEVVLSLTSGKEPPEWCLNALPQLAKEMKEADRRGDELERRTVDFVETVILADRCGETFEGVVVELGKRGGTVQLREPAVLAPCDGPGLRLGSTVSVRLAEADTVTGRTKFELERPVS